MNILLLILLNSIVIVFAFYSVRASKSAAPFLPTRKKHIRTMLKIAKIQNGETLMDLGSGDGRIVLLAAKNTGAHAIGVELNPLLVTISKIKKFFSKNKNRIIFIQGDLWKTSLHDVDILTLFFIKPKMKKLEEKIRREMKPGSRVVSYIFTFEGWQPEEKRGSIFLYRV